VSHLPARLARRIDRLARRAHAFHRFAHHPMCVAYAPEVSRLGRRARLCRGCLLALLGAATGASGAALLPLPGPHLLLAAFGAFAALALAWMACRARGVGRDWSPRTRGPLEERPSADRFGSSKWITRFAPTSGAAALAILGTRAATATGAAIALGAAALVGLALHTYRRSGPNRSACRTCPELGQARACSGLRPIVRREAAFQRLAGRWLDAGGAGSGSG
jgi:hypothetical protein